MRITSVMRLALVGALSAALAAVAPAQVVVSVSVGAPPALPVYEQPPLPAAGYIWTPGYWAYDPSDGYYWVPGTWEEPPEPGLLWTPGYWGWGDAGYTWYPGYWATQVGFYGGINYGYGYGGSGYEGGYWNHGAFYYNRSVTKITNTTNITNVYNKTVINNTRTDVSYNGGSGGTAARATAAEVAVGRDRHVAPTAAQTQHAHTARADRAQWASTNHGRPAVVATPKPGTFTGRDVVTASQVTHAYRATSTGDVSKSPPPAPAAHAKAATPPRPTNAPRTETNPNAKDHPTVQEHKAQEHPEAKDQRKPEEQPKASAAPEQHKASAAPEQHKASAAPEEHKAPPPDQKPRQDQKPKQEFPPGGSLT